MKKTIEELRGEIYTKYGVDVDDKNSEEISDMIDDLKYLRVRLENQEEKVKYMKEDFLCTLETFKEKYKDDFDTIYLFGKNITLVDEDDIDFEE